MSYVHFTPSPSLCPHPTVPFTHYIPTGPVLTVPSLGMLWPKGTEDPGEWNEVEREGMVGNGKGVGSKWGTGQ